jgi:hypothetical protein
MLVGDIMETKKRRKNDKSADMRDDDDQDAIAHDRLRKLFSKRLQRGPKTPPRRI